jgi:hypothetical protein
MKLQCNSIVRTYSVLVDNLNEGRRGFMMRQFWPIVGLIFLVVSAGSTDAQTASTVESWVRAFLPKGVTVRTSTCDELPPAVKAAIRAHPKQAKAIVRYVFSQFTDADKCKALAVIDAINSAVPADEVADVIKVAIGSLSATVDPQTGLSAQLALASLVTQQAIADNPSLASAIVAGIGAAPPGPASQLSGPGGVTNPANFSNTSGAVISPP